MAAAVPDVASLLDIASATDPTPVEETPVETTEVEASTETPVEGEVETKTPEAGKVDARTNPDAIRKALKTFRDSSPENAPIARELNDTVGRWKAAKDIFPGGVNEMRNVKAQLAAVGGIEGLTELQNLRNSVGETDSLLYAGDGRVVKNLIEDFKKAGKLENFGKLATPFLNELRGVDEKAYFSAMRPHFHQGIVESGFPDVLDALNTAISNMQDGKPAPDFETLKKNLGVLTNWFNKLDQSVKSTQKTGDDPERVAFEKERTEFKTAQQKEFQNSVNKDWNSVNAEILGGALKPFLKMPFAKNWSQETKVDLAEGITSALLRELTADKGYQGQMDAFWSEAKPDKSKIVNYHRSKVETIGKRIVEQVLNKRYPGFKTSAVAMKPKPAAPTNGAKPIGGTKPTYTATKLPLDEMDMAKDPDRMLLATGKAYSNKTGKLMSWNAKDK